VHEEVETAPETDENVRLKDENQQLEDENLQLKDENQQLAEDLLASRDTVINHEAKLGEALGAMRRLEAELVRYETRMEQLDAILGSTSWRLGGVLHRAVRRLGRRNHS
jgi:hypothetical protein